MVGHARPELAASVLGRRHCLRGGPAGARHLASGGFSRRERARERPHVARARDGVEEKASRRVDGGRGRVRAGILVSGIRGAPIFASPASTITGSIGVLAGKFDASELYRKLGIKKELIAKGRRAGFFSESAWLLRRRIRRSSSRTSTRTTGTFPRENGGRARQDRRRNARGRAGSGVDGPASACQRPWWTRTAGCSDALAKTRSLLGLWTR